MIRSLQSMRGIAAVLIYYHHFGFGNHITDSFGDFGVAFFMMLSGFVLSNSYRGRTVACTPGTVGRFIGRRVVKIYPTYLLCWILAVCLLPYRGSRSGILLSSVMLQSFSLRSDVYFAGNGVSWFVSDLMLCYLLFIPLLVFARSHIRMATMTLLLYFTAYFSVVALVPAQLVHAIVYINPVMQLSAFVIGMILGGVYGRMEGHLSLGQKPIRIVRIFSWILCGVAVVCYCYVPVRFSYASYWWLPVSILILSNSIADRLEGGIVDRVLHNRHLIRFGDISLSFYLIHMLGIRMWQTVMGLMGISQCDFPLILQSFVLLAILYPLSMLIDRYYTVPVTKMLT